MEPITPKILVVGATGRTGSATISALTSLPNPPNILALTRSPSSPRSKSLLASATSSITLAEGTPEHPTPIFAAHSPISAIYLVTVPPADEAQAIPLIDAAIANSVPHIVFSSVDRGGDDASWENPTAVPHFAAKHRVELHLRDKARGTATRWTILRPTGFMDNYGPSAGAMGPVMGGLWATMPRDRKMQLVSARDIGLLAARALMDGPQGGWANRTLGLAGDEISFAEAEEVFQRVVGRTMPRTWGGVGRVVRWAFEDAGRSMEWFEGEGYKADIEKIRAMEPRLQTWEAWLRETSGWVKGDGVDE
ncbi:nucleoside-diphosphate-sugar epimerase family protein (NmrA-like family protein) [Colletotrichum tofieldiae]|uniref:Nucleoside-diphosphate-sugar epimerase family protein (NmrA-like family protein) n=1 Tax=Colletotrichum tofieldiae TaxID=708197 RepID=A0A166QII4_9PEZI|nr:nucleoside-diphosphate-sugar epimerase family protein (NmrA-like family protein) [Colletotrichum tofieldiae]